MYVILFLFSFQTIWITSDSLSGLPCCRERREGGGVRGRGQGGGGCVFTSGADVRAACTALETGVNAPELEVADDVEGPFKSLRCVGDTWETQGGNILQQEVFFLNEK